MTIWGEILANPYLGSFPPPIGLQVATVTHHHHTTTTTWMPNHISKHHKTQLTLTKNHINKHHKARPTQQLPPALSGDVMQKNLSCQYLFTTLLLTRCSDDAVGCESKKQASTKIVTSTFIEWPTKLTLTRYVSAKCLFAWLLSLWEAAGCRREGKSFSISSASDECSVYYLQFTAESDNQFLLQSAGFTLTTKRKSQKKQQIIQSKSLKWEDTFFGAEKLLFWPWCSCRRGPAREPVFCRSGNKLTKAGIAPSRTYVRTESRAASYTEQLLCNTTRSIEPRRNSHKNTLDFTLTARGTKRGRGVNWYDVTNPSSQQAPAAALINSAQHFNKQAIEIWQQTHIFDKLSSLLEITPFLTVVRLTRQHGGL